MPAPINNNSNYDNYSNTNIDNQDPALDTNNANQTENAVTQVDVAPELYPVDGADLGIQSDSGTTPSAINNESITAKNGKVSLQYQNEDGSTTDVAIGKDKVTFSQSVPGFDEPVTQEIRYADIANGEVKPEQLEKLDELSNTLNTAEGSEVGGREGRLLEKAKARVDTLQDPAFWSKVNEGVNSDDNKLVDLANGERVVVEKEYKVERMDDGSFGVDTDDDGKLEKLTVDDDGSGEGVQAKRKGNYEPLRIDDNGDMYWVTKSEKVSSEDIQDKVITEAMTEQTQGSGLRALPVEQVDGQTQLNNLEAGENEGQVVFGYNREGGATDQVKLGNNAIKIETTIPNEETGDSKTVEFNFKYAQINEWGSSNRAMVNDARTALQNVDTSQLTPEQQTQHSEALSKLNALEDPAFWNSVNTKVAEQVNGQIGDEAAVINEEFRLIERINVNDGEKTFFIDRGEGREEVEINDDETVTLDDKKVPVRLDQQSGDWYVVTDHEMASDLTTRVVGQHMKVRGEQAANGQLDPLTAMAQRPNPMTAQINQGQVNQVQASDNAYTQQQVEELFQQVMNDPELMNQLLQASMDESGVSVDMEA